MREEELKQRIRVVVVQRSLLRYRVPLFEGVRSRLAEEGITLDLVYGEPEGADAAKRDAGRLPWALPIKNRVIGVGSKELIWQPCLKALRRADLIIVEQASRLLINYLLLLMQLLGRRRLTLWGHGRNFQEGSASRIGEAFKRTMSRHVHWWFAYNDKSAGIVRSLGFPAGRITVVQNSTDTAPLIREKLRTGARELSHLRSRLGLQGNNIGVFVGSLYENKRLGFVIEAAREIRRLVPDFELIIIGAGPQENLVRAAEQENPWIKWVGAQFEANKVPYIMLAKVMLLPASVGLAVVDSFALEVPVVTLDSGEHGPEVDYLVDGVNGLILPAHGGPREYGEAVASLVRDEPMQERLRSGCREAAEKYTLEEMVERFAAGIGHALADQGRRNLRQRKPGKI